jgi:hypothetical protein
LRTILRKSLPIKERLAQLREAGDAHRALILRQAADLKAKGDDASRLAAL